MSHFDIYKKESGQLNKINSLNEVMTIDVPVYLLEWLPKQTALVSNIQLNQEWVTLPDIKWAVNGNTVKSIYVNYTKITSVKNAISNRMQIPLEDLEVQKVYSDIIGNYEFYITDSETRIPTMAEGMKVAWNTNHRDYWLYVGNGFLTDNIDKLTIGYNNYVMFKSDEVPPLSIYNLYENTYINKLGLAYLINITSGSTSYTVISDKSIITKTGNYFSIQDGFYPEHILDYKEEDCSCYICQGFFQALPSSSQTDDLLIYYKGRVGHSLNAVIQVKGYNNIQKAIAFKERQLELIENWDN